MCFTYYMIVCISYCSFVTYAYMLHTYIKDLISLYLPLTWTQRYHMLFSSASLSRLQRRREQMHDSKLYNMLRRGYQSPWSQDLEKCTAFRAVLPYFDTVYNASFPSSQHNRKDIAKISEKIRLPTPPISISASEIAPFLLMSLEIRQLQ